MIVWAVSLVGTDWEAMSEEALESFWARIGDGVRVADRTTDAVNTIHSGRASSRGSFGVTIDFRDADATKTLMSRRAVAIVCTDRIAVSEEALGAFWAGIRVGVGITYPTACTIDTFKAGGTISVVVTAQDRQAKSVDTLMTLWARVGIIALLIAESIEALHAIRARF